MQTISPVTRTKLSLIVIHVAEGHNSDFIFFVFACSAIVLVDFVVILKIINKVIYTAPAGDKYGKEVSCCC